MKTYEVYFTTTLYGIRLVEAESQIEAEEKMQDLVDRENLLSRTPGQAHMIGNIAICKIVEEKSR
jgi:hypothetical protein